MFMAALNTPSALTYATLQKPSGGKKNSPASQQLEPYNERLVLSVKETTGAPCLKLIFATPQQQTSFCTLAMVEQHTGVRGSEFSC